MLPTPTTQEGGSALPAEWGRGPHQATVRREAAQETVHQVLSELTTAQPSTTVSGGGHGHLTDRRGRPRGEPPPTTSQTPRDGLHAWALVSGSRPSVQACAWVP